MAEVLSQEEIDALLSGASFDETPDPEPVASLAPAAPKVEPVALDMSKFISSIGPKIVHTLHEFLIGEDRYYSEPGQHTLHNETHAHELFNFDRVCLIVKAY